jgi:hypothetical protein
MDPHRLERALAQKADDLDARAADEAGSSLNGWIAALVFCIAVLIAIISMIIVGAVSPSALRWIHTPTPTSASASTSTSSPVPDHPSFQRDILLGGGDGESTPNNTTTQSSTVDSTLHHTSGTTTTANRPPLTTNPM